MSDSVLISIITGIVSPSLLFVLNYFQNKKIDAYHKEVNGRMGELIQTTKALGKAEGTAIEKAKKK